MIEFNLYKIFNNPEELDLYDGMVNGNVDIFWDTYKDNADKLKTNENLISSRADYSYKYAKNILDGQRFPKGEDAIATNAEYAFRYARDTLKKRFKKGEDVIYKSEYSDIYDDFLQSLKNIPVD